MSSFDLDDRLMTFLFDAYEMGYDSLYLTPDYLHYRGIGESDALKAADRLVDKGAVSKVEIEPDRTIVICIKETLNNIVSHRK